jgi:transposase-like protein
MQGKRFTEEFKLEAVRLVTERQVSVREVSKRLGGIGLEPVSMGQALRSASGAAQGARRPGSQDP